MAVRLTRVAEFGPLYSFGPAARQISKVAERLKRRTTNKPNHQGHYIGLAPILPVSETTENGFTLTTRKHSVVRFPYPFADQDLDEIHFHHVQVSSEAPISLMTFGVWMDELKRILKPNGRLFITYELKSGLFNDANIYGFRSSVDVLHALKMRLHLLYLGAYRGAFYKSESQFETLIKFLEGPSSQKKPFDWLPDDFIPVADGQSFSNLFTATPGITEIVAVLKNAVKEETGSS